MFENKIILLSLAILLAAIPIAVWLYITLRKGQHNKKITLAIFGLGCLTAPALLGLQIFWEKYPQFNLLAFIEKTFAAPMTVMILTLLLFASMEEIIKLFIVKKVDKKTLTICKINDAIVYSIASALGFSFVENAYYLYSWWPNISTGELAGMYFFRSIFTTASHMVYSGVFGYFYGIGKFSMVINQQNLIKGTKDRMSEIIAKIFNLPQSEGFRQKAVLKGLFIAIGMHFTINYLLQMQQDKGIRIFMPIVLIANILMFLFLQYLLSRKAGHLILLNDPTTNRSSTIGKKDKDVVVELLAMWSKDKRYVDVIHVCERLLERDPDNTVVKLFKAQAMDAMDEKNIYRKVLSTVVKTKDDLSDNQKNIISKYLAEKEMFQKVKQMIKEHLAKEGKKFIEPTVTTVPSIPAPTKNATQNPQQKDVLEKYTDGGTFNIR